MFGCTFKKGQNDTFASRKPKNRLQDWPLTLKIIIGGVDTHWC